MRRWEEGFEGLVRVWAQGEFGRWAAFVVAFALVRLIVVIVVMVVVVVVMLLLEVAAAPKAG